MIRIIIQVVNCKNQMIYCIENHYTDKSDVTLICLAPSVWISITSDGVTSLSRIRNKQNTCKGLYHKVVGNGFLYEMEENWKNHKDTFAVSSFLLLKNGHRFLLSDLLPRISLIVGCDISTSRLTAIQ